jgi:hypothetical protein
MSPRWARNSSNKAHVILEKLFRYGSIEATTQPKLIYDSNSLFQTFPLTVFRTVFNELKSSSGLLCKCSPFKFFSFHILYIFIHDSVRQRRAEEESLLDDSNCSSPGIIKALKQLADDEADSVENPDARVTHHNRPILMTVYKKPVTQQEMLIILCVLPIGATEVRFTLVGSGPWSRLAIIDYLWPPIIFEIENLFAEEIKQGDLADCHPKINALKEDLKFTREYLSKAPKGSIELALPIPVQTASKTIKRYGKNRKDGSQNMIVELMAFQTSYTFDPKQCKIEFKATGL